MEEFFDRGFNKIMCYLHVRMRGFKPYFIPDGYLVHDVGIHHGKLKIPTNLSPEDEEVTEQFAGLYRETVIRHLLFQGFCELITQTGWLEAIAPQCDSLCVLSPTEKMIVGARNGKIQLRKCYSEIIKLQGLKIEDQARLLAMEYRMPYEEAVEFGAKFANSHGDIPIAKLQALKAKADKRKKGFIDQKKQGGRSPGISNSHSSSHSNNNNNKYSQSSSSVSKVPHVPRVPIKPTLSLNPGPPK
uniref:Uncharacterized protein n=1 Tax=Paramoeba aestuarina TaxID=180227 RepID=A0A7S4KLD1_9EUKA